MKRIVPLFIVVLALAVPVSAFAEDPPARPSTPSAQSRGQHAGPAGRLRQAKLRLRKALRHCKHMQGAERQACFQRVLDRLEALKARIDKLEAKIKERCPGVGAATEPSSDPAPTARDKCSRAPRLLAKLERLKARIDKLEARIKQAMSGDGSSSDSGASSDSDADSIADLESQLAAVATQQG